ncbi:MAG: helix-turn-helix domain-containing protein [Clostridia bacterium]|jgi:ACT domain-containing protein|nr:helix-turn-helix domain-containing protein [Clostridia bacterium]
MKLTERWNMYSEIKRLKELGLRVSQIVRHLDISRNTVYQYKDLEPDEYDRILEDMQTRRKITYKPCLRTYVLIYVLYYHMDFVIVNIWL